jgi:predicted peptidase
MGGYGTWSVGLKNPERFAAIVPICGGGSILDVLLVLPGKQSALKNLPVWAFHGAKDPVVPVEESEQMINALTKAGNQNTKLTVYSDAGHDSWTEAYNSQELYDWLLQHTRAKKTSLRRGKKQGSEG